MICLLICLLLLPVFPLPVAARGSGPDLTAGAAVLIDARTGLVLYGRHASRLMHPASTTKIITAILGLELESGEREVNVSRLAALTGGTSVHLQRGDCYRLSDLIRCALINSGNDAAVAIAEALGGSVDNFGALMTAKLQTIGGERSRFYNPHGLTKAGHLTTAYELAMITRYALNNGTFSRIVATASDSVSELRHGRLINLYNTNRLLGSKNDYQIIGVKTGTTDAAGQCLVTAARSGEVTLISVVLNSSNRYQDTTNLLDYGFHSCQVRQLARTGGAVSTIPVYRWRKSWVNLYPERDLTLVIPPDRQATLEKRIILPKSLNRIPARGTRVGRMEVLLDEHPLDSVELVAGKALSARP